MFENIENLKLQSIYEGISAQSASFENKPSHFMIYKLYGESEYYFAGAEPLRISDGQILFVPQGASYSVKKLSEGESRYISVRFSADGIREGSTLCRPVPTESVNTEDIFRTMNSLWIFGTGSKKYRCYSLFYSLLASLSADGVHEYAGRSAKQVLTESMSYLEKHIFDPELSVDKLVKISGMSGTYFRKCFLRTYGVSPKEYICEKRISGARSIFDGGDFASVSDVAKSVGYEDALYFSRVFKKKYGVAPSAYNK